MPEQITCKNFDFVITTKCTLNCKLCSNGMPYMSAPFHTPKETAFRELREFFRIWDYVDRLEFVGGEPLFHPDFLDILRESLRYSQQFGKIRITTNSTILPKEEIFSLIHSCGTYVEFLLDDYGLLSPKLSKLIEKCDKYDIPYRVNAYTGDTQHMDGWVYFGDCETRLSHTEEEWKAVVQRCAADKQQFAVVHNGKVFFCTYAMARYQVAGVLPENNRYIELLDDSIPLERKREQAKDLWGGSFSACGYCMGFGVENAKRYPAAEQVPRRTVI